MYTRILGTVLGTLLVVGTISTEADAQRRDGAGGWTNLGCVTVGHGRDRDVIKVGSKDGKFRSIQVFVTGSNVHIDDLNVVYGNGKSHDIKLRSEFREGSKSRVIDLQGDIRGINRIVVVNKKGFKSRGAGKGRICISGQRAIAKDVRRGNKGGRGGKWVLLGCQRVGFAVDKDTIRVGRKEGNFKAIQLKVTGNTIYINDLNVVYGNGKRDDIRVRNEFKAGSTSRVIDLRGRDRFIDRIEMLYRSKPSFRGYATVCVSGKE